MINLVSSFNNTKYNTNFQEIFKYISACQPNIDNDEREKDKEAGFVKNIFRVRIVFFLVAIILIWIFLWYSHSLVRRLEETRTNANETIARFWAGIQSPLVLYKEEPDIIVCSQCGSYISIGDSQSDSIISCRCATCNEMTDWFVVKIGSTKRDSVISNTIDLFQELIKNLEYTSILTDSFRIPQVIDGCPINDSLSRDSLDMYAAIIKELDRKNEPVPIIISSGKTIGYLHYGTDDLSKELSYVPYIELGILLLLAILLLMMIRADLSREKEMSWVGFAKETAHQISTPLSSLLGWVELLKERPELEEDPEFKEAIDYIGNDLQRLEQIAQRYGQMGKKPVMQEGSVNKVILNVVHYFSGRPGLMGDDIEITTDLQAEKNIEMNEILLGWVFENLLKNAFAGMSEKSAGFITISTRDIPESGGMVEIEVADSGKGIPHKFQKKIFNPGFSTRRGGWGLGLTLSRRIIEEYHGGKIRLKVSSPGKGTTFVIHLSASKGTGNGNSSMGR